MIQGRHVSGCGQACEFGDFYRYFFNCPMHATFNVEASASLLDFEPAIEGQHPDWPDRGSSFWLVRVEDRLAWAYRHTKTGQSPHMWELVSKARLPISFRSKDLSLGVLEPWDAEQIEAWCEPRWRNQWHQTFPWSPRRCDSEKVWNAIGPRIPWSQKTVLDIGCNYGFHSFQASKQGAQVLGHDTHPDCVKIAQTINDHIESSDVSFTVTPPDGKFDVILYLSVHHQHDPGYETLKPHLDSLKARCNDLFVELILPPMFGDRYNPNDMDRIVGGTPLLAYQHNVRGIRRVWHCT